MVSNFERAKINTYVDYDKEDEVKIRIEFLSCMIMLPNASRKLLLSFYVS